MVNPFNPKYPVRPQYFANRKAELARFERDFRRTLDSGLPENIAILGDWGVGKSSLAFKFMAEAQAGGEGQAAEGVKVAVSGLTVPASLGSMDEFCYLLLYRLQGDLAANGGLKRTVKEALTQWRAERLNLGPLTVERPRRPAPQLPLTELHTYLVELWRDYLAPAGVKVVVLVLDDLHHLLKVAREGILDLRSLFQELPRFGCNYQLVVTGPRDLFGQIRELAEPMGRFFSPYELDPFTPEELAELVRVPLRQAGLPLTVTEAAVAALHGYTLGNPYFATVFLRVLIELKPKGTLESGDVETHLGQIISELAREKFSHDMEMLSESETQVVHYLLDGPEVMRLREIGPSARVNRTAKALQRLVEKGIVTKVSRGRYALYHPLFKLYLSQSF